MESTQTTEKRLIKEIITMYDLEPELHDIYVEGPSDKCLLNCFFKDNKHVNIVEINDIDFSELYESKPYLKSNCKNKVIELSTQLEENCEHDLKHVICISDRDFDDFLDRIVKNSYLHYTDYSSIEMYFYNATSIDYFFNNILHGFPFKSDFVLNELSGVLNHIFNIKLSLLLSFGEDFEVNDYDFKKTIKINKSTGIIEFNPYDYINRYLTSKKMAKNISAVSLKFDEIMNLNPELNSLKVRGHDFISLLFLYLDKIKNNIELTLETFERIILVCIDIDSLNQSVLFKTLKQKYLPLTHAYGSLAG